MKLSNNFYQYLYVGNRIEILIFNISEELYGINFHTTVQKIDKSVIFTPVTYL